MNAPSVLLVAGAYHPEISAAGLQCQAVARALRGRARMSVLATAIDRTLPAQDVVDDVPIGRVRIDVRSRLSKASASMRIVGALVRVLPRVDVVHVHGFSQKNVPVAVMARLFGKPVVLTLHTAGQDEPQAAASRGRTAEWAFRSADLILPVSPNLERRCTEAGVPPSRIRVVPNGIDTERFQPPSVEERRALRRQLGWNEHDAVILFVGFFSRDKRPDLLFRAWTQLSQQGIKAKLVYVGATASPYFEIDHAIAREIRDGALRMNRASDVTFVEPTHAMERYYRAADVFVLPSIREANPVALLEAMACGLPCIATCIEGATDVIIERGRNGLLVPRDDEAALTRALADVLSTPSDSTLLGHRARQTVVTHFDIRQTADRWLNAYRTVLA